MQKTRTKTQARGHMLPVAHRMPYRLQFFLMILVHLDISQQSKIISRTDAAEMSLQKPG
jgi:hypothetical protein